MDKQSNSTTVPAISIAGIEIDTNDMGLFSLNALHRASKLGAEKAPAKWSRNKQTSELVAELEKETGRICLVSGEGRDGGTFADELLAVSYAGWISPRFQLTVNQAFLDIKSGKLQPTTAPLTAEDLIRNPEHLLAITQGYALQIADLRQNITAMQEDVDTLHRLTGSEDLIGVRATAKLVQMPQNRFVEWLKRNRWAYRQLGSNRLLAYAEKEKAGMCRNVATTYDKEDGTQGVRETLKFFPKGIAAIARKLNIVVTEADMLAARLEAK